MLHVRLIGRHAESQNLQRYAVQSLFVPLVGLLQMDSSIGMLPPKVSIVKKGFTSLSATTYIIREEGHTLGNVLRWMLMKKYVPCHACPIRLRTTFKSEFRCMAIRIRPVHISDNQSSLAALIKALDDLDDLFRVVHEKYKEDMAKKEYERFHEES
ncbi:hypothetical protein BU17DRAFT_66455 [Hysterangium stoloniferum]|nr:hypothetical protein BU17DRAFT_66455 [Hysterangium stoloniferum]